MGLTFVNIFTEASNDAAGGCNVEEGGGWPHYAGEHVVVETPTAFSEAECGKAALLRVEAALLRVKAALLRVKAVLLRVMAALLQLKDTFL